jgi:hypothetical protein
MMDYITQKYHTFHDCHTILVYKTGVFDTKQVLYCDHIKNVGKSAILHLYVFGFQI